MVIGGVAMVSLAWTTSMMFAGIIPLVHMAVVPMLFALVSSISIGLGIASGVGAVGLYKGKGWAWMILTIIAFIGIGISVISLAAGNIASIVGLLINGAVVFYLYRPHVKQYFGRNAMMAQAA